MPNSWANTLEDRCSIHDSSSERNPIFRITNPFFFMASGFLFFFAWRPSFESWLGKMRKRIYTLLFPYLVWSVIGMTLNYSDYLADNLDRVRGSAETPALTFFDAAVYFFNMPVPPQLWFLRALMLMMLCTPLVALVICALKRYSFLLVLMVYFSKIETPWDELSKSAFCFFSLGAVLGYLRHDLTLPERWVQWSLFALWISLATVYSGLSLFIQADYTFLFHCLVLSGITGIWGIYDLLPVPALDWLSKYSPYRFFIYMASEPLLTILRFRYFETFQHTQSVNLFQHFGLSLSR